VALEKVLSNQGAAGKVGVPLEELRDYLNANWANLKQSI
jgi:hypothetical protein